MSYQKLCFPTVSLPKYAWTDSETSYRLESCAVQRLRPAMGDLIKIKGMFESCNGLEVFVTTFVCKNSFLSRIAVTLSSIDLMELEITIRYLSFAG